MLTYLPSGNFDECARLLHRDHIKRCIQEAGWIGARLLRRPNNRSITASPRWQPTYTLWVNEFHQPFIWALRQYQLALNRKWMKLNTWSHLSVSDASFMDKHKEQMVVWPEEVHASHRNRLACHPQFGSWYQAMFEMHGLSFDETDRTVFYANPVEVRDGSKAGYGL